MIFVDPRHGSKERKSHDIGPALDAMQIEHTSQMLDSGDACFFGNGPDSPIKVGIELKLVPDFVGSMLSGRLTDQLERLTAGGYQRVYLIIEGFYRASRRNGLLEVPRGRRWRPLYTGRRVVSWADVERFITGIEETGVRIRRTRTPHETSKVIGQVLYGFWQKEYSKHQSLNTLYVPEIFSLTSEDETTRRIRRFLVALKSGVGSGRSKAVAEHFGSIYNIATSDEGAWTGIPGVGAGVAAEVVKSLHATSPGFTLREPSVPATRRVSTSSVPKRHHAADSGTHHSRQRQDKKLDAGCRPQRAVRQARRSHRSVARRESE